MPQTQFSNIEFFSDADIAKFLKVSKSWVRSQRFRRRKGADHSLTIDPVMFQSMPRYRSIDFVAWVEAQAKREA